MSESCMSFSETFLQCQSPIQRRRQRPRSAQLVALEAISARPTPRRCRTLPATAFRSAFNFQGADADFASHDTLPPLAPLPSASASTCSSPPLRALASQLPAGFSLAPIPNFSVVAAGTEHCAADDTEDGACRESPPCSPRGPGSVRRRKRLGRNLLGALNVTGNRARAAASASPSKDDGAIEPASPLEALPDSPPCSPKGPGVGMRRRRLGNLVSALRQPASSSNAIASVSNVPSACRTPCSPRGRGGVWCSPCSPASIPPCSPRGPDAIGRRRRRSERTERLGAAMSIKDALRLRNNPLSLAAGSCFASTCSLAQAVQSDDSGDETDPDMPALIMCDESAADLWAASLRSAQGNDSTPPTEPYTSGTSEEDEAGSPDMFSPREGDRTKLGHGSSPSSLEDTWHNGALKRALGDFRMQRQSGLMAAAAAAVAARSEETSAR